MKKVHAGYYQQLQNSFCAEEFAISKDVDRTFPDLHFFEKDGKGFQILFRILKGLAVHMKDVGYCQGINFLAAIIYLNMDDEESTFWMLVHLLQEEKFKKVFSAGMKRFKLACYQLESLLRKHLPKLAYFFVFF